MVKFIFLLITLGLAIFVRAEWLYASALLFFIFLFSWIIKSNKQQPGETDEDYAKRMEKLKEKIILDNRNNKLSRSFMNTITDPQYSYLYDNVYHNKNKGL